MCAGAVCGRIGPSGHAWVLWATAWRHRWRATVAVGEPPLRWRQHGGMPVWVAASLTLTIMYRRSMSCGGWANTTTDTSCERGRSNAKPRATNSERL
eukprot:5256622-Prymnesium_polylepis.1